MANNDDFDDMEGMEDLEDSYNVITIKDENGEEVECMIIDSVESDGSNYLLIIESDDVDEDEPEAMILKEVSEENDEVFYEPVLDDDEYNKIVALFSDSNSDYDFEI